MDDGRKVGMVNCLPFDYAQGVNRLTDDLGRYNRLFRGNINLSVFVPLW
jgi:hypothetical protein